jgi:hypothetical protein
MNVKRSMESAASTHQSKATTEEERKATLVRSGLNVNVLLEGRAEADVAPPVVVVVVVWCVFAEEERESSSHL